MYEEEEETKEEIGVVARNVNTLVELIRVCISAKGGSSLLITLRNKYTTTTLNPHSLQGVVE